eukprot:CAMPEP_0206215284 /NCGR_PEP_ID=MMETSP0047_2-20121206/2109_1 /ASSEMBLY_ACC=CAM_ASM_000192 /TAXON_ID=195065 /ORGANISM="Chroomonas mesostigmatica_cf, Strain CCMP1168" /LENGTH=203 /DNA_ID=CAMNT_0053637561 /DNA_START=498 /DNA_END=1111 /DNA_ORIENTATION=-
MSARAPNVSAQEAEDSVVEGSDLAVTCSLPPTGLPRRSEQIQRKRRLPENHQVRGRGVGGDGGQREDHEGTWWEAVCEGHTVSLVVPRSKWRQPIGAHPHDGRVVRERSAHALYLQEGAAPMLQHLLVATRSSRSMSSASAKHLRFTSTGSNTSLEKLANTRSDSRSTGPTPVSSAAPFNPRVLSTPFLRAFLRAFEDTSTTL